MEASEIIELDKDLGLPPSPPITVGIAINRKKKSKYVVKWALDKFVPEGKVVFKLLHVRPKITTVPTPMGNSIPISQIRDDVAAAYMKEVEWQTNQMLLPYKNICTMRKVQVDVLLIESNDVANAIAEKVVNCNINKLVIGADSRGMFARKIKRRNLSSRISVCTPNSCTVYAVSKGKLASIRPSDLETNGSTRGDSSVTSCSTRGSLSHTSSSHTGSSLQAEKLVNCWASKSFDSSCFAECADNSVSSYSQFHSSSLPMQRFQALSSINQGFLNTRKNSIETNHFRCQSLTIEEGNNDASSSPCSSEIGHPVSPSSSFKSLLNDCQSWASDQPSTSDILTNCSSSNSQVNVINFELEKLRIELRHVQGIYAVAQSEAIDASRKLNDLNKLRLEEATRLEEIKDREKRAKELVIHEKEKCEAAMREAEYIRECAEREASQRHEAEIKAMRDAKEKEKLENALVGPVLQYQKFTWQEIVSATESFSEHRKIGMGAYGNVYKCSWHHTTAAVKVLHSKENHNTKQFQQELEILSKIRHPHLLILLGACPDHGCLVYEYMENGSLEERLLRVNKTPPIPWFERYRIAWEVASALAFLHHSKPNPIIHRDLKPANILLDHNFVSKIGDVGLSTMLHSNASSVSAAYNNTGPVGTLCYIDPEYQRTGLISPKSDVYAFGIIILQLLTAKPAMALAHLMETAIEDNGLAEILDSDAGNWPFEETKELAMLGLKCVEMRRRDRPDLQDEVLPTLERLKEVGNRANITISSILSTAPNHFICPILKDVMSEPCVAADGYTYDRNAIEKWLQENDTSPMTNLPLPNKNLLPNFTLLSAIMGWKSKTQ